MPGKTCQTRNLFPNWIQIKKRSTLKFRYICPSLQNKKLSLISRKERKKNVMKFVKEVHLKKSLG